MLKKQNFDVYLLLVIWVTIPLVLFSAAQTKLGWYVAVTYPAIALLISVALSELLTDRRALAMGTAMMAVFYLRVPGVFVGDGSWRVKAFAAEVNNYITSEETIFVFTDDCKQSRTSTRFRHAYSAGNIKPSLMFYLQRAVGCIDRQMMRENGQLEDAYFVFERTQWEKFETFKYVLGKDLVLARPT